ncbi:DUF6286 domain-containing protein [Streptomyces sp. NPDC086519]|uniref:DUF6286 domain-containing protein n=1 Tax=Streptomyces sp. NPDC086519 TaxID=3154863 RepID=UPI003436B9E6
MTTQTTQTAVATQDAPALRTGGRTEGTTAVSGGATGADQPAADRGRTSIADLVVVKVAGIAARELTGLDVPTARIRVTSLAPVAGGSGESGTPQAPPAGRTPGRLCSRRRVPDAVLAAVAAVACGALALDLVMVHAAHRPAAVWRVEAVRWLSEHGPGDRSVAVAGGLTAVLGLWMIVLAVTPGLRRRLTVRSTAPPVVAAVDRSAAEALVREAVGEVAGVGTVRVRGRRRRVPVRAEFLCGQRAEVRAEVTAAADGAPASCGLRGPRRLRLRVTPSAGRQPPAPDAETAGDRPLPPSTRRRPPAPDTATTRPPATWALGTVPEGEA